MPRYQTKLLSVERDAKTIKSRKVGQLTGILYLAPAMEAFEGTGTLCPHATVGCLRACLFTAGYAGVFPSSVIEGRIAKTRRFLTDRSAFIARLEQDIEYLAWKAAKMSLQPAVRLNGTSDIRWERIAPSLFTVAETVGFYDYTKWPLKYRQNRPAQYHLTFSLSEHPDSWARAVEYLSSGSNAALVVRNQAMREHLLINGYRGFATVDGDKHDARFVAEERAKIAVLTAKGRAKQDTSGFVLDINQECAA